MTDPFFLSRLLIKEVAWLATVLANYYFEAAQLLKGISQVCRLSSVQIQHVLSFYLEENSESNTNRRKKSFVFILFYFVVFFFFFPSNLVCVWMKGLDLYKALTQGRCLVCSPDLEHISILCDRTQNVEFLTEGVSRWESFMLHEY